MRNATTGTAMPWHPTARSSARPATNGISVLILFRLHTNPCPSHLELVCQAGHQWNPKPHINPTSHQSLRTPPRGRPPGRPPTGSQAPPAPCRCPSPCKRQLPAHMQTYMCCPASRVAALKTCAAGTV
eukprot:354397-Chlamydomonas_euryale.AAC.2